MLKPNLRCMNTDSEAVEDQKLQVLHEFLRDNGPAGIALSGGVDSVLLAAVAARACDTPPVAFILATCFQAERDTAFACEMARQLGIEYQVIRLDILGNDDDLISTNPEKRCYFCKKKGFSAIRDQAGKLGITTLYHGINLDDLKDDRPGIQAAQELGFKAPFVEAGFSKAMIRSVSRDMGLETWDRPSQSCLATRIPYGVPITLNILEKIEQAEYYLYNLGIQVVRVRCHGALARIETDDRFFDIILDHRERIFQDFKQMGFNHTTLDLKEYGYKGKK